ncbi:class I SAM-dependent methyltransferase [Micromonospora sp. NPDC007271]|uniref:class I SAM-dependent methyltransferase n=1 Tax=Micromonospora sp. NPDC007271 TaxID=3154587 RepID=UPI0033E1F73F
MGAGFSGEVAAYYARHRRGYPPEVLDAIVGAFGLSANDTVVDLGCGTGQLSLPIATRVGAVVGVDPEPDMLALARRAALKGGRANAAWLLGTDRDLPVLSRLLGDRTVGAVTVAVAIHFMDRDTLFRAARPLLRPGGGIAVITNGTRCGYRTLSGLGHCVDAWKGCSGTRSLRRARPTRQAANLHPLLTVGQPCCRPHGVAQDHAVHRPPNESQQWPLLTVLTNGIIQRIRGLRPVDHASRQPDAHHCHSAYPAPAGRPGRPFAVPET